MRVAFNSSVRVSQHTAIENQEELRWGDPSAWILRIGIVGTDAKPPPHRGPCECCVESWGLHRDGAQGQLRPWSEVRPWEGPDERAPGSHQGSRPLLPQNQSLQGQGAHCVCHFTQPSTWPKFRWYPALCRCDAGVPQDRLGTGRPALWGSGSFPSVFLGLLLQVFRHQFHLLLREHRAPGEPWRSKWWHRRGRGPVLQRPSRGVNPRKEVPLDHCPPLASCIPHQAGGNDWCRQNAPVSPDTGDLRKDRTAK